MARNALTAGVPRLSLGGVFIRNPGFESSPSFTAAQTASNFIDGTEAGSATNDTWRWYTSIAGTYTVQYDTTVARSGSKSIKIVSSDAATGNLAQLNDYPGGRSAANIQRYCIQVKPSTQYTFSYWLKRDSISATNSKGFRYRILECTETAYNNVQNNGDFLTGTADWTQQTLTWTTAAGTTRLELYLVLNGETGTAWVDDITLTQTGVTRTVPTYPRNPMGAVYIPGAKSIEGATGDVARTTNGWIEDAKYGWRLDVVATAVSAEFDTAVTRTGVKTLKVSTTDATGRAGIQSWTTGYEYLNPPIKPSTAYVFSCWVKTNNVATNSVYLRTSIATSDRTTETQNAVSSALSGTNDWTLLTISVTTDADAAFWRIQLYNVVAGNISDAWFDVNSMTLIETGITRNPVV